MCEATADQMKGKIIMRSDKVKHKEPRMLCEGDDVKVLLYCIGHGTCHSFVLIQQRQTEAGVAENGLRVFRYYTINLFCDMNMLFNRVVAHPGEMSYLHRLSCR
jgi:hypothetical protein